LFCYEISMTVGYEISLISMMVGFGGLRDLNDGRFSVLVIFFCFKIWKTVGFVPLFFYENSMTVSFVSLRDLSDGRFCWVTRSQWRLLLLGYEISVMVCFAGLWDLSDGRFSVSVDFFSVIRFQRRSVLFHYKISLTVGFVPLRDFNDGQFWWVTGSQWRSIFSVSCFFVL